jgi:hypothetical protein
LQLTTASTWSCAQHPRYCELMQGLGTAARHRHTASFTAMFVYAQGHSNITHRAARFSAPRRQQIATKAVLCYADSGLRYAFDEVSAPCTCDVDLRRTTPSMASASSPTCRLCWQGCNSTWREQVLAQQVQQVQVQQQAQQVRQREGSKAPQRHKLGSRPCLSSCCSA